MKLTTMQRFIAPSIALVILGLSVGCSQKTSSTSASSGPTTAKTTTDDRKTLTDLANSCQGDFSKLSSADQQKVQQLTNGAGKEAIRSLYMNTHH